MQPYVALGVSLKARGFDVTICTGQGFQDFIEGHGLSARSLTINYRTMLQDPEVQDAIHTFRGKFRAFKSMQSRIRQQHDEMLEAARDIKPDLIISNAKGYVAHNIARWLGVPSIPSMLQPIFVETGDFPPALLPGSNFGRRGNLLVHKAINTLTHWMISKTARKWAKESFDSDAHQTIGRYIDGYHPDGQAVPHLHGYSRHIVPKPSDWGEREHITGYWFLDADHGWTPPQDLRAFIEAGDPPVYVGFGSMPAKDAKTLTVQVVATLEQIGARGVLATGWGGLEDARQSERMFVLDHAPHDWLF
nr:glycosyltransferase [Hyphomicrobiales bacterium]